MGHSFDIQEMTLQSAHEIVRWKYESPYDLYNLSADQETIQELMDGTYFAVFDEKDELAGFFCYGKNAQVPGGRTAGLYRNDTFLDIGLGLHPDLTGHGHGLSFLQRGLAFGKEIYGLEDFRLSVADFNKRAIKLYEKAGFKRTATFINRTETSQVTFLLMEKRHS